LKVGDVHQIVEVTTDPGLLSATTEDTSGLVGERQVKDLPLNGRSYDQLLTLNPGTVNYTSQRAGGTGTSNSQAGNMFAVSGHRPQENLFLLNGVEYTGASEIGNTPGGVSGQLLGVDAVREFAVIKDAYGAEYGKRPGAQVSIVTAGGTNRLHGSIYEFARNSALDARNFFDQSNIPDFQRNVFGGSLGGPIRKDRTFLFGNYEGYRQNLGLSDVTLVPDATSRAKAVASIQPLLALWPVANGPEILTSTGAPSGIAKAFSSPEQNVREDFGTARLDQVFSEKDTFSVVYTADDSYANTPTSNPFSFDKISLRAQVTSLEETHIFTPNVVNKATFGFSRGNFFFDSYATADLPGWVHADQPVGAVVVGGGTTLNGASQITNGGSTHPIERFAGPGSIWSDFLHEPANFPARHSEHVHLRAELYPAWLAHDRGRSLRPRCHQIETESGNQAGIPRRIHQRLERSARASVQLRLRCHRHNPDQSGNRRVGVRRKQRNVSSGPSRSCGVVAVRIAKDRHPRWIRHLLRAA
jgi:hypothetical protein